jgi:hypothetical protein
MVEGRDSEAGPQPPNLVPRQWSLLPPVVIDSTPFGEWSTPCSLLDPVRQVSY